MQPTPSQTYIFIIHFNIIIRPTHTSPKWSLSFRLSDQNVSSISHVLYIFIFSILDRKLDEQFLK
jgi:hypothetical protein